MKTNWFAFVAALGLAALGSAVAAKPAPKHLLVVTLTLTYHHDSIAAGEETLKTLGLGTGDWTTDYARTADDIKAKMTPAALKNYDAVAFVNTTGDLPLPDPQGFLDYIHEGHGFVAIHAGSDTLHNFPGTKPGAVNAYAQMLGAEFDRHGHDQCAVEAHLFDPKFPANRDLLTTGKKTTTGGKAANDAKQGSWIEGETWHIFDEIYLFKNVDRKPLHVLLAMDKHPDNGDPTANAPGEYLVSWTKAYGKGRVYNMSLGHRREVWQDPLYQAALTGGIRFALGSEKGSTVPTPPDVTAPKVAGSVTKLADGLEYTEEVIGMGAEAVAGHEIVVHYVGTLMDGTKFDSSRDHGTPFTFTLGAGNVIKGWEEGFAGMKVGGKRKLVVPPGLAYGDAGAGGVIPPNATLVFEVELLEVK